MYFWNSAETMSSRSIASTGQASRHGVLGADLVQPTASTAVSADGDAPGEER
jgi:hypothetical protein